MNSKANVDGVSRASDGYADLQEMIDRLRKTLHQTTELLARRDKVLRAARQVFAGGWDSTSSTDALSVKDLDRLKESLDDLDAAEQP